jgi:uncharacterized protein YggE
MKRITTAMVIGVLAGYVHASPLPEYPFVYATGEAEERIAPDTCSVSFGIHIRDKDPTNGVRLLEARSAEVLDLLAKHEVKREDIVGCAVSKTLIWEYAKPDRPEFHGYAIGRDIVFTLRDLRKYEPIVSALLKTPDVTDINESFGRTDRKEIESRLSAKAVVDARANAQLIAEGAGQRIVKLRAVKANSTWRWPGARRRCAASRRKSSGAATGECSLDFSWGSDPDSGSPHLCRRPRYR